MLYMVELNFLDPEQEPEWDAWYLQHLYKLLNVPGFRSAQRFKAVTKTVSPLLAIYDVESSEVMTSEPYRLVGGRGSADIWKNLLSNWHRNLFNFNEPAPDVPANAYLLLKDRKQPGDEKLPPEFTALTPVGLDKTIVERGIKVASSYSPEQHSDAHSIQVFRPMTHRLML